MSLAPTPDAAAQAQAQAVAMVQRRRAQNRMAQRRYREKMRAAASGSAAAPAAASSSSSGTSSAAAAPAQDAPVLTQPSLLGALAAADAPETQTQAAGVAGLAAAPLVPSAAAFSALPPPPRPLEQHASLFLATQEARQAAPVALRQDEASSSYGTHAARDVSDAAFHSAGAPDLDWLMHDHSPLAAAASSLAGLFPPAPAPSVHAGAASATAPALQSPTSLLELHSAQLYGPVPPATASASTSSSAAAAAVSPSSDWARILSSYVATPSPTPSGTSELPDSTALSSWLAASPRLLSPSPASRPSGSSLDSSPTSVASASDVGSAASAKAQDECREVSVAGSAHFWSWTSALRSYPIERDEQKRRLAEQRALLGLLVDGDPMGDSLILPRQDFRRAIVLNSLALGFDERDFHNWTTPSRIGKLWYGSAPDGSMISEVVTSPTERNEGAQQPAGRLSLLPGDAQLKLSPIAIEDEPVEDEARRRERREGVPRNMWPTKLQLSVPHPTIIDALPWPAVRDRLIAASSSGMICIKTAKSDAVKGGACEGWHNTAFCVHGAEPEDNFDEACWEVAEDYAMKYWFLFDEATMRTTNRWRRARGVAPIRLPGTGAGA
ncbi:hypothetical protein FA09DRAFT_332272 [Tilletiopsis washingtonensis]|uniref:BZIP domain-containing protein n=1 Tax=Tilletiopsis washingtonensis TaxID=58919 RepID=A0A316Z200_9BASI|nr:hypothetical protein FA09DRAFT_332272 [Tilletiopsis washingtonensis]PWN95386.1 hypothetical protein FA09DRAFT_332272 [Tilletiopsis washingtonensis]